MRKIEPEILDKLKAKYGINKLRKVVELYGLGIPEKYWFTTPTSQEITLIDDIITTNKKYNNLVLYSQDVAKSNRIASELLKRLGKIQQYRYIDFMTLSNSMIDKFGQMNLPLLNELAIEEIIVISNIKSYGQYFLSRVYPLFAGFLDSLANSIMDKKILLVLETTDDGLDGIGKSYEIGRAHV